MLYQKLKGYTLKLMKMRADGHFERSRKKAQA